MEDTKSHSSRGKDGRMANLKPLIAYLIDQVMDQEGTLNKTALVKLVYLIDVECCRRLGRPATSLEWRFHHYGPYSAEMERDVNDNAFIHVFGDRNSGYGFAPSSDWRDIHAAFNRSFDPAVRRVADSVAKQWGREPLETLLEYVYFETEPMQNARRGETLDFSKIQPEETSAHRVPRLSFSEEFISNLRTRWDERRKSPSTPGRVKATPSEPVYDEIYEDALELMADDEGMTPRPPRKYPLEGPSQGRPS